MSLNGSSEGNSAQALSPKAGIRTEAIVRKYGAAHTVNVFLDISNLYLTKPFGTV